jgi:glycerate-2-kinase
MLISGGGSTLLCLHDAPMTCLDESTLFGELTEKGATIQDINVVRKHISLARGGALAKAAYPAEVLSLIVSDVPENDIEFIASGPTVMDSSTVEDARALIAKYGVAIPAHTAFIETPKEQKYFERVTNVLFLTNQDALIAMKDEAEKRGYAATIVDDHFDGEARDTSRIVVEKLHDAPAKSALLYAGESTVTLSPDAGAGGRNQEMALAALGDIRPDELILPFASDGHDNTDFAGAIADETTRAHALAKNVSVEEYLNAHRSYDFFTATGDALQTGYTGSNVSDLILALKK